MIQYGQTIVQTKFDGTVSSWTLNDCNTFDEAQKKCIEWAKKSGWTPPKWWQWWRWKDTKIY